MQGKMDGRRRGQQRVRYLNNITDSVYMNSYRHQEIVDRAPYPLFMGSLRLGHDLATKQQ